MSALWIVALGTGGYFSVTETEYKYFYDSWEDSLSTSYYELPDRAHFEKGKSLEIKSSIDGISVVFLSDDGKKIVLPTGKESTVAAPIEATKENVKPILDRARADRRTQQYHTALKYSLLAVLPPLGLLFAGIVLAWIGRGFTETTASEK
jgi:hypothetical protein